MFAARCSVCGITGTDGYDVGGWQEYGSDWRFFFDCMFAPVVSQAAKALERLDVGAAAGSAAAPPLLAALKRLFTGRKGDAAPKPPSRPVAVILPRHGPVVRAGVTQLLNEYSKCALPSGCLVALQPGSVVVHAHLASLLPPWQGRAALISLAGRDRAIILMLLT